MTFCPRRLVFALVLGCTLLSLGQRSQAKLPEKPEMAAAMKGYFGGEKRAGGVFLGIGLASLAFGGVAIWRGGKTLRAASVPVMALGLVEALIGSVLLYRTDAQVAGLLSQLDSDASKYALDEMLRMEKVRRSFTMLKWIELGVIFGGAISVAIGSRRENRIAVGVGAGLCAQAAVALAFDVIADARAARYLEALGMFRLTAGVAPDGSGGVIGLAGLF
ncbi:MAG: hypothetical protein KC503_23725 [Myxococcales bacterium]|nr:hypothetical protein [Myxococcales bacterium]